MSAMQAYAEAFERLPAALRSAPRRAALNQLLQRGLPTTDEEDWKYTDLMPLQALAPESVAAYEPGPDLGIGADGVDALNFVFASGGLNLQLAAGQRHPDVIRAEGSGHRRHRLHLGANSEALLRLQTTADEAFQTAVLDIELEAGAQLRLVRVQDARPDVHRITRIRARLHRDAMLDLTALDLGGKLSRHDVCVDLLGPGAQAHLRGLFVVDGDGHTDNHTRVDHRAVHGNSREVFRGIALDRGHGVFNGKVVVHPGAQKTDSEQRIANLILSPKAEINAKPELEIYADDVKCAHGATFGQLDLQALFYLRSRGIPEAQARSLLQIAFALEPLRQCPDAALRDELVRRVVDRLGAGREREDAFATDDADEHG
ncbi:MAG: Fe-S cluster assembly protein SufD [Panacagrimonas sp.]